MQTSTSPVGLTTAEAAARLRQYGQNVVAERTITGWVVLLRQLRNPLLGLLLVAAAVSAFTGGITDSVIISVLVALGVGLGFIDEYRSERAVAALHATLEHRTLAHRDGELHRIDVREVVPGDVLELRMGDVVPADGTVLVSVECECDEAVLTGESLPVAKSVGDGVAMGTVVHLGRATVEVTATGARTDFGHIAAGLTEHQAPTRFQIGLHGFSGLLAKVALALTSGILVVNLLLRRPPLEALMFSLAIAIGITPQLLPAVVSTSLSVGSRHLAARKVLVKRMVAIEDLGNIRVLFTDKTGTLTEGAIRFDYALDVDGRPDRSVLLLGMLCDEATHDGDGTLVGSPLDIALLAAEDAPTGEIAAHTKLASEPFDHERQMSSVLVRTPTDETVLVTKGAPEAVMAKCTTVPSSAGATLERLFTEGRRVVAVASRVIDRAARADGRMLGVDDEHDLALAGFLTFADPPRPDAAASLARLRALGVDVKIITGDNGTVATTVCREMGLEVTGVLTGVEVEALDDHALAEAIDRTTVFARVGPTQKSRIVAIARATGDDVAFMGDGVNDAVALHTADVGISVDGATDVARDAADIVLLDKDLGVLADGVLEGRRTFANTLKYVLMATSSNFGNMFSAAGASIFLGFLPMLPSQVLLNNLLYDVGQLSIPTDRVDPETTARPAAWDLSFVCRFMLTFGPISSVFDFLTFWVMLGVLHAGHDEFRTGWFVESLATQTLVVYLIRTRRIPFLRSHPSPLMLVLPSACAILGAVLPFTPLAGPLGFTALPLRFFLILLGMVLVYLCLVEMAKARFYAQGPHPVATDRTGTERHHHKVRRRARPFVRHTGPAPRLRRRGGAGIA